MACDACWPEDAEEAWARVRGHRREARLMDEPHFSVVVFACAACGQRFVDVFCERIDWQGGQDPQAWLIVPVSEEEARTLEGLADAALERAIVAIAPKRRCLAVDHGGGPRLTRFVVGPHLLAPHD
jgi:hypothetical protein